MFKGGLPRSFVYPSIEQLHLSIREQWPSSSFRFLTSLISFSNLQILSLSTGFNQQGFDEQFNSILKQMLQFCPNVHSLKLSIGSNYLDYLSERRIHLSKIIPSNIKHLQISISKLNHFNMIIDQLTHLSSIHFHVSYSYLNDSSNLFVPFIRIYERSHPNSTYTINRSSLFIWINNRH